MRMRTMTLLLAAGLAAACVKTTTNPVTGKVDVDVESPTKHGEDWSARLTGQGAGAAMIGELKGAVIGGNSEFTLTVSGAPVDATLPWHVHEGTCGSGGPIVGDASAYSPLVVGADGRATQTARVTVSLNEAKKYHVNVHASPTDLATIVACGNLDD
jgi:hypothetical protein